MTGIHIQSLHKKRNNCAKFQEIHILHTTRGEKDKDLTNDN